MIIPIDEQAFTSAGLGFQNNGSEAVFTLPDINRNGEQATVKVAIIDGALMFFPDRATAHRKLLARLGRDT